MAMTITAEKRPADVKTETLRMDSKVPAVLYGFETENQMLTVHLQEFNKIHSVAGSSQLVELSVDGKVYNVLIKDVQIDPLKRNPIHIDFHSIDTSKPVQVNVPLHFIGEAPAVKASGGSLVLKMDTLEVECLPKDLAKFFEVSVDVLKTVDDSITVADIEVGDQYKVLTDPSVLVASVAAPRVETADTPATEETEGAAEGESAPAADASKEGEAESK